MTQTRKRSKQRTLYCRDCHVPLGIVSLDGRRVRIASRVRMVWLEGERESHLSCPECGRAYQLHRAAALYITLEEGG